MKNYKARPIKKYLISDYKKRSPLQLIVQFYLSCWPLKHCLSFIHKAKCRRGGLSGVRLLGHAFLTLRRLHILLQKAVVLMLGVKTVQGGDLLPGFVSRRQHRFWGRLLEEALEVPLGQALRVLRHVLLQERAFLAGVLLPELQLQVAHRGSALGHTGEQEPKHGDASNQQPP